MEIPAPRRISWDTSAAQAMLSLRILQTTDLHGHIRAYDYFRDRPGSAKGLASLASQIIAARAETHNCLLFDTGDFLQGTPLTQLWGEAGANRRDRAGHNPMIAAMNAVGYDAATLGNHDFDFGLAHLSQAVSEAEFPITCANLRLTGAARDAHPRLDLAPWMLLERELQDRDGTRHKLRIGLLGILPPSTRARTIRDGTDYAEIEDMLTAARRALAELSAEKPDLVIALAHTGIAPLPPQQEGLAAEHAALALAALDEIDIVLAGHDHTPFPHPEAARGMGIDSLRGCLMGKPAINAGALGAHLGILDLTLERHATGWQVTEHKAQLRAALPDGEAPEVVAISDEAHRHALRHIRHEIGRLDSPLHSFFSLIGPDPSLTFYAQAQCETAHRLLEDRPRLRDLPMLCAVTPFNAGGRNGPGNYVSIPPGPLQHSHLDALYLFNNTLAAVEINGAELREWLEQSAVIFHQIAPGSQGAILRDMAVPSYAFDVISGLTYTIDLSQPARYRRDGRLDVPRSSRIRDLCHNGKPVDPEDHFVLFSTNFRLAGGGHFWRRGRVIDLPGPLRIRDILRKFMAGPEPVDIVPERIWHFAPMPDTSVVTRTSPQALDHLDTLRRAGMNVAPLGCDPDGFLRLQITL